MVENYFQDAMKFYREYRRQVNLIVAVHISSDIQIMVPQQIPEVVMFSSQVSANKRKCFS